jgi:hypothetical protein
MSNSIEIQVSSIVCQHISEPIVTWHIIPRNISIMMQIIYCLKVWIILNARHIDFRDLWYKILNTCKLCSLWNCWIIIQEETSVT